MQRLFVGRSKCKSKQALLKNTGIFLWLVHKGSMTKRNWYRAEMTSGAENFYLWGASELGEQELLTKLATGEFVTLEDLIYFDEEGAPRSWNEWDPQCQPRVFLNSKFLVSLMPLVGDPRKAGTQDGGPKVLAMPRLLPNDQN